MENLNIPPSFLRFDALVERFPNLSVIRNYTNINSKIRKIQLCFSSQTREWFCLRANAEVDGKSSARKERGMEPESNWRLSQDDVVAMWSCVASQS